MIDVFVGIDLGGTNIRVACSDIDGNIFKSESFFTNDEQYKNSFEDKLIGVIQMVITSLDGDKYKVISIGMGIPGIYYDDEIKISPNIEKISAKNLIKHFEEMGIPFFILNDVKCAAMGEKWKGSAENSDNFIFINIGTGLSVAMMLNGSVYLGNNSASGEIAYWISEVGSMTGFADGRAPLEEKFSGRWITEKVKNRLQHSDGNGWTGDIDNITTKGIFDEYTKGNVLVKDIIDDSIQNLVTVIANICILINPELIVFGGGVSTDLESFLDYIKEYLTRTVPYPPIIRKSGLEGKAGIYGAINLAINSIKNKCFKELKEANL
jgi:glucokinase